MPKRKREDMVMPVNLQYEMIADRIHRLRPDIPDEYMLSDNREWIDDLDETFTLQENISNLVRLHPELNFLKERNIETAFERMRREKRERRDKIISTSWISDGLFQVFEEEIKPHKPTAKGKHYEYGRIQIILKEKKLIGQRARVTIFIPGAHKILYPQISEISEQISSSKTEHVWFGKKRENG